MRYISAAFTGYRTEKLPFEPTKENLRALSDKIRRAAENEIRAGVKYFMSGVCRGSDLLAADAVLSLRDKFGVELWCAVPFQNHRQTIPYNELELYDRVLKEANGVIVLYKRDADGADFGRLYNERNRFMVNRCDGLIAVCPENGILPGGTKNTVEFARRAGKKVIYVL
jgi:uncharacterized phage-like protein YoqJ